MSINTFDTNKLHTGGSFPLSGLNAVQRLYIFCVFDSAGFKNKWTFKEFWNIII